MVLKWITLANTYVSELVKRFASTYNKIWHYNLNSSIGKISDKILFYQFGSSTGSDASETMTIRADKVGALFVLRDERSEITKLRPNGKMLAIVHTAYSTSVAVALGYKYGKTLYIGGLCLVSTPSLATMNNLRLP